MPLGVHSDAQGNFEFKAALLVGSGGVALDFDGYDDLENTNLHTVVGDGFCSETTPEGEEFSIYVWGRLLDPLHYGRVTVWLGVCMLSGQ